MKAAMRTFKINQLCWVTLVFFLPHCCKSWGIGTPLRRILNSHGQYQLLSTSSKLHAAIQDTADDAGTDDWREFRAKLVLQNKHQHLQSDADDSDNGNSGASTKNWAYEAGSMIEAGSIILSRVPDELGCHDLRQPYFHKAAILVLEHDDDSTRGIILNRPSNLLCSDGDIIILDDDGGGDNDADANPDNAWPMNFGGDIAGLFSDEPMIVCLHTKHISSNSNFYEVLPNLWVTSHKDARELIAAGEATCDDFQTFYGFCLWKNGQLQQELDREFWYMASMDSQTVWESLLKLSKQDDPQRAGVKDWEDLIAKIDKANIEPIESSRDGFRDCMLKEWCRELLSVEDDDDDEDYNNQNIFGAMSMASGTKSTVGPGSLVRSSDDPSTFLLFDQLFHKSTILILKEEEHFSMGLILNLPTTRVFVHSGPGNRQIVFPIRYGGVEGYSEVNKNSNNDDDDNTSGGVEGSSLIWLHCSQSLRDLRIGKSIANAGKNMNDSIWTCSHQQVLQAVDQGLALPNEFLAIDGCVVWEKEMGAGGVSAQLMAGSMVEVPPEMVAKSVWPILQSQQQLSKEEDVIENFDKAVEAWLKGSKSDDDTEHLGEKASEGKLVFGTSVPISELADDALRTWIRLFLLNDTKYVPI
eukprot:scaffold5366_cov154-Chaetoceros_neogracile.AAC.2